MIYKTLFCLFLLTGWATCEDSDEPCMLKNLPGTCIPFASCKFAITILSIRDVDTLRSMFCGFEGNTPKVCCPATSTNDQSTTPKPLTTSHFESKIDENEVVTPPAVMPTRDPTLLPDRDVCGQIADSNRIYGGSIASIDEFPWIARLRLYKASKDDATRKEMFACSGSLINDRYVLTAAHCITVYKVIGVRLGEWDTETTVDCENGFCNDGPLDVKVDKVIYHPDYDRQTLTADIALLRLEQPVKFTDFIKPICLPTSEYVARQDYIDSTYTNAGWGKTEFGQPSVVLRKVNLDYVSYPICAAALPSLPKTDNPNVICAGGTHNRDSCQGDSGGPLLRIVGENFKQNWFIYGVTSYGVQRCGSAGKPAVYTRVSKYMDWILDTISGG